MRRLLVCVVLTAAAMSGAACSSDSKDNPSSAPTTAAANNTQEICSDLKSADEALTAELTKALPLLMATAAPDQAQLQAAITAFQPQLSAYLDKLQSDTD